MKPFETEDDSTLCPSSRPEIDNSVVFGIVEGTVEEPRVAYLEEVQHYTTNLLEPSSNINPTEVLRFASPCAGNNCLHFDGLNCKLGKRIVHLLPAVVESLPPCRIRPNCFWWKQDGKSACIRCPQIVSENPNQTDQVKLISDPYSAW